MRPILVTDNRGTVPIDDATGSVLGTYLHGLFGNAGVREAFFDTVLDAAGKQRPSASGELPLPYETAAALVEGIEFSDVW